MPPGELQVGTAVPPRRRRASWHAVANGAVLAWLVLTVVAVVARDPLPAPRWLVIHAFLLGAVTNDSSHPPSAHSRGVDARGRDGRPRCCARGRAPP